LEVRVREDQETECATLWFLAHTEIAARQMVELAVTNWMAAKGFGADDHERGDLAILADLFLDDAQKSQERWSIAGKCASSAFGS
jgi:hypothetical protein